MNDVSPRKKASRALFGCLTITAIGLLTLGVIAFIRRGALPPLTRQQWEEGKQRWKAADISSYRIRIRVSGRQAAEYRAEVIDGRVSAAWRNDAPLKQQRTLSTWSVPGMFATVASDLSNLEKWSNGQADAATPRPWVRVFFHPQYGYPQRYYRSERGVDVSWEVLEFESF